MSKDHFFTYIGKSFSGKSFSNFRADERGGRAIEFSLLVIGIVVAIIAAIAAFGAGLEAAPSDTSNLPN